MTDSHQYKVFVHMRATSESAKAVRREKILAAAAEAFDRLGHDAMSMEWLAERAGIAKGTVYLYFSTKESVFLSLFQREQQAWLVALDHALEKLPSNDVLRTAGLIVDALDQHPRLPALAAILHTVLERNIDEDEALAFRQSMLERMQATGQRLEARLAFLEPGDGARLLLRVHALLIGCWHVATPAAKVRRLLEQRELAGLRVDFSEEFENALVLLLEGWRHGGGGF